MKIIRRRAKIKRRRRRRKKKKSEEIKTSSPTNPYTTNIGFLFFFKVFFQNKFSHEPLYENYLIPEFNKCQIFQKMFSSLLFSMFVFRCWLLVVVGIQMQKTMKKNKREEQQERRRKNKKRTHIYEEQ